MIVYNYSFICKEGTDPCTPNVVSALKGGCVRVYLLWKCPEMPLLGNAGPIRDQRYRSDPEARLRQFSTVRNADAGLTFFRHLLMIFQHHISRITPSAAVYGRAGCPAVCCAECIPFHRQHNGCAVLWQRHTRWDARVTEIPRAVSVPGVGERLRRRRSRGSRG